MDLMALLRRNPSPEPWSEGENIPWHDPAFSERMLAEHLTQAHDAASRRVEVIDRQVDWIHEVLLEGRPARVLDLGCGPGLYASRLARRGHRCMGIDYSPASIAYATRVVVEERLTCQYVLDDLRRAEYGSSNDLVMLIYGELNVFRPSDADAILCKAYHALAPGGLLLLEPHTYAAVQHLGEQSRSWSSSESGLFLDAPHLYLKESVWDAASATATIRYYIVAAQTARVTRYAQSLQAYSDEAYREMLGQHGFADVRAYPSLTGSSQDAEPDLFALIARRP